LVLTSHSQAGRALFSSLFTFAFLLLTFAIAPHAVFDVVVDDEVEFFVGEAVVLGKDAIATDVYLFKFAHKLWCFSHDFGSETGKRRAAVYLI
jgi:hypothetical protein